MTKLWDSPTYFEQLSKDCESFYRSMTLEKLSHLTERDWVECRCLSGILGIKILEEIAPGKYKFLFNVGILYSCEIKLR